MKFHKLVIPIKAPNSLSAKKVAHLVDRLIAIGLDEAWESDRLEDDAKDHECSQALKLEIGQCRHGERTLAAKIARIMAAGLGRGLKK